MKRILSLLLIFAISTVFADGVMPAGHGTEEEPYQIATLDNLLWLSTTPEAWSSHYIQTADIDASDTQNWNDGEGFSPIGEDYQNYFSGSYDGQSHSISSLFICRDDVNDQGFFGYVDSTSISNLSITDATVTGYQHVGIVVATAGHSSIYNCEASGIVMGYIGGGGICGICGYSTCENSSTDVEVTLDDSSGGGICGSFSGSEMVNCHSAGSISGLSTIGGLAGSSYYSEIQDCSSLCNIESSSDYVGGLIGSLCFDSTLENCISQGVVTGGYYVGGIVGVICGSDIIDCCRYGAVIGSERHTGGVAGWAYDRYTNTIDGCSVVGDISGDNNVGGIVGYSDNCTITNSWIEGNLTGNYYVKGIVGYPKIATIENSFYNYEVYTINGQHWITAGALGCEMFEDWKEGGLTLDIDDYLNSDGEHYLLEDTHDIRNLLGFCMLDGYSYRLTENIDMEDDPGLYIPLFRGSINGNGHVISNLSVSIPVNYEIGLFGCTENATISSIIVENLSVEGFGFVGGLIGKSINTEVTRSSTSGTVSGYVYIGGIVGFDRAATTISQCFSVADVTGNELLGGLIGGTYDDSSICDCYSRGDVSGVCYTGGFIGATIGISSFHRCYSTGLVGGEPYSGGFTSECPNDTLIVGSFWDIETSGQEESDGGIGLPTAAMTTSEVYLETGWDFVGETENGTDDIWVQNDNINDGYPYLSWQEFTPVDDGASPELHVFQLDENSPNPFNPTTTISYSIPKDDKVVLKVYNIKGQLVKTLVNDHLEAGTHNAIWNGDDEKEKRVSSGVYLYRLESGGRAIVKKMLLLK